VPQRFPAPSRHNIHYRTTRQRQKDPALREAVALAARGDASASLSRLTEIREVRDARERHLAIAADYARLPEAERARTIVVAGTNEARREINRAIRDTGGRPCYHLVNSQSGAPVTGCEAPGGSLMELGEGVSAPAAPAGSEKCPLCHEDHKPRQEQELPEHTYPRDDDALIAGGRVTIKGDDTRSSKYPREEDALAAVSLRST